MNRASSQTLNIAKTLAWEFWAHGWRRFLWGMAGIFTIPGLIFAIEMGRGAGVPYALRATGSFLCLIPFYWMLVVGLGALIYPNLEYSRRRYALPASAIVLVVIPMACAMLAMFAQYAIVAMILNGVFDNSWPIVGPGLLAAVLIAWFQTVLWSTSNSLGLRWLAILASIMALMLAFARWGSVNHSNTLAEFLPGVGGQDVLPFGLVALASVALAMFGFATLRHGAGIDLERIVDLLSERLGLRWVPRAHPFSSARAAQFWLECQERGYVLPVVVAMLGMGSVVLAIGMPAKQLAGWPPTDAAISLTILVFSALFVIGFFWGSRSPILEFRPFNGSRPLSDRQLAAAVLKSATLGLITSALIWTAFMVLVVSIVALRQNHSKPLVVANHSNIVNVLSDTLLGALIVWSVVSFITSLALGGKKVLGVAFGIFIGVYVLLPSLCQSLPQALQPDMTMPVYFKGWLLVWLLVCAAAFVVGCRWHLISLPAILLATALIVTAVGAACVNGLPMKWESWPFVVFCCLLPVPLAAAPLAVYVNRHR